MSNGLIRLWCRQSGRPWGILETAAFDDAMKKAERRAEVLKRIELSLINWMYNYAQYRDAQFCIEEQPDQYSRPFHIQGTPRDRKLPEFRKQKGKLVRKLPSLPKPTRRKKPGRLKRRLPRI